MGIQLVRMANSDSNLKEFGELVDKYNDTSLNSVAEELIKKCIFRNLYYFDGDYHQRGEFGAFVFKDIDGEEYIWWSSMRYFGDIMADVWSKIGKHNSYDYIDFYMGIDASNPNYKVPKSETEFLENMTTALISSCEKCCRPITSDEFIANYGLCDYCKNELISKAKVNK